MSVESDEREKFLKSISQTVSLIKEKEEIGIRVMREEHYRKSTKTK
jgi:hypothetical protein